MGKRKKSKPMDYEMLEIGRKCKIFRLIKGKTLNEMGEIIGCSKGQIWAFENGNNDSASIYNQYIRSGFIDFITCIEHPEILGSYDVEFEVAMNNDVAIKKAMRRCLIGNCEKCPFYEYEYLYPRYCDAVSREFFNRGFSIEDRAVDSAVLIDD